MGEPPEEFPVDLGSPFAMALAAARAAAERHDGEGMDAQYRRAFRLARDESADLRTAVAVEHVSRLRALGDSTRALARCEEYLAGDAENIRLLLRRAETALTRGDYSRIDAELPAIHRIAGGRPKRQADDALLSRLEGLAAARRGQPSLALRHLGQARGGYAALGDDVAVTAVDGDIRAVTAGRDATAAHLPASAPDVSPQARLTRSEELRVAGRYEEALDELELALADPLDPALHFFFLEAKVRLLRLLRADDQADDVMPVLYEAARGSAQPAQNRLAAHRFDPARAGLGGPATREHLLQLVRRLVREGQLTEAEQILLAERAPAEPDDRHAAEWHLAAGELTLAIAERDGTPEYAAARAIDHFQDSVRHAAADSLVAIRITALRLLGHAYTALQDLTEAVKVWAAVHRLEESIAALQPTDDIRLRMLRAAADEFDGQIRVAAQAIEREPLAMAAVVVAMEAARGAAILPHILPDREALVRDLPSPGDIAGARRWIRQSVRGLPRSQVIWMLHATPDEVHHAFIWRQTLRHKWRPTLRHKSVPCPREKLIKSIEALANCWRNDGESNGGERLEQELAKEQGAPATFDRRLSEIAELVGLHALPELPKHVTRIAVVAGGELAEIPFALLPCPRPDGTVGGTLIGRRYALSDLPCLSVRQPLHRRSRAQRAIRGTQLLVLRGPDDPDRPDVLLTPAADLPGRRVLAEEHATPGALRAELAHGRYRQVRIDSHGRYGGDPSQAAIQLAPWGTAGKLSPEEFQSMNLSATGTLVLGACETGMEQRIGRDERTGFVRAALLSGASAVLAARWEALDPVAARVLDRFERNLRHYPRDVALFLAQRAEDTRDRGGDPPSDYPATEAHPARWAPWVLFGDVGHQSSRGRLRRSSARAIRRARHQGSSDA